MAPQTQEVKQLDTKSVWRTESTSISLGFLMGGGSLVGADIEVLVFKNIGIQVGAGIGSFGGGINYHFRPYINTQFVSFQYFHQGFGDSHYASYFGPMYVFRAKKYFQAGIGMGAVLTKGPNWDYDNDVSMSLIFNIGLYIPF